MIHQTISLAILLMSLFIWVSYMAQPIQIPVVEAISQDVKVEQVASCPKWLFDAWKSGQVQPGIGGQGIVQIGDADIESKYPQKGWRPRNPKLDSDWEAWKTQFSKYYFTKNEEEIRRLFWEDNKALVDAHNRMYERGGVNYLMHLTGFSDLAEHEYRNMHASAQGPQTIVSVDE